MAYTVGEMARRLGVPASTIRYYDKEGLLPFVGRSSGGIRAFTEKDFEWLRIIECLKKNFFLNWLQKIVGSFYHIAFYSKFR